MVTQHPNGYFINGAYHEGDYERMIASEKIFSNGNMSSQFYPITSNETPVGFALTDSRPSCMTNGIDTTHACVCHGHDEPSYGRLLLIGIMLCVVALLAFMVGASL